MTVTRNYFHFLKTGFSLKEFVLKKEAMEDCSSYKELKCLHNRGFQTQLYIRNLRIYLKFRLTVP